MQTTRQNASGFTLVELIITVGIISVVMAGATVVMPGMLKQTRADASAGLTLDTLRLARDRAIGERRNLELHFILPNHIQIVRQEIPDPAAVNPPLVTTVITDVYLEGNQKFTTFTGMTDTPDLFGLKNIPIAFGASAGTATVMFTSEGTLVDVNGDPINGTVFIGTKGDNLSTRAITIFGPTALLHTWRWDGKKWAD
jgi:prepilin-type N-terminal cleavage/methylation domain-containing protein